MPSRQFFTYILVGILCAVIDIGLMQLLIQFGVNYLAAATFGFIAGLITNFLLHSSVTFGVRHSYAAFTRYIAVVLFNYLLTLLAIEISIRWLETPLPGKILSLPAVAMSGFILSKYWIYKER